MPEPASGISELTIRMFGPFEVGVDGRPIRRLRTRKGEWLLVLLALRAGREVERGWLAGTLWPDSAPEAGLANLRCSLKDLRRALGPAAPRLVSSSPRTLRLDLTDAEVDVGAFDRATACGDVASLQLAVSLYRGPLLEGCIEEWLFEERQAREQAYLQALEGLAADARSRRDHATAERYLRCVIAIDPLQESAQRALMEVLVARGSYAAALQVYRELRLRLHHEHNAEPDPETTALFQRLRVEARARAGRETGSQGEGDVTRGFEPHRASDTPLSAARSAGIGLVAPALPTGAVTFLFSDIEGSTRLWEKYPGAMTTALARHNTLIHEAILAHGGILFKTVGDACCAAFQNTPAALAAAVAAQRALQAEGWEVTGPLPVRMALHTGVAEEREDDYFGPVVNRVARLLETGHGGQVLLSLATQELARDHLPDGSSLLDLGEHALKDLERPERIFQLVAPDLPVEFPPLNTVQRRLHPLPALRSPLLGREVEVAAVRSLLGQGDVGLLTLTGPGGTGKTRLGLQVATELMDAFAHGVCFVDLAPLTDPGLVASTIAQALGVREAGSVPVQESLKAYLREKQLLLVLDNFEQILAAAPLVAELLAAAPRLKVLATSRAPLRVGGEQEYPVSPLSLPDPKRLPPVKSLSQYAAVELFIQRATAARPEFVVTNENAPAVAEICHRLDGLPLAIELAATRIRFLTPQTMLARLGSRLKLLTGGARDLPTRQQTLRDTIAWSYDLLSEAEKRLFRRLSVFVGGCTLEAAEAVCNASGDLSIEVFDGMASLVEQSLLQQELPPLTPGGRASDEAGDGEPRFTMLETIREFGRECLASSGEEEAVQREHAQFFLALAEQSGYHLVDAQRQRWLARLERDYDNLRAALTWSLSAPAGGEIGLRLVGSLEWFWYFRGYWSEGRRWLQEALARSDPVARTAVRAKALQAAGSMDFAVTPFQESVSIWRELGDQFNLARSLVGMGWRALWAGDLVAARPLLEEVVAIARETGDRWVLVPALNGLRGVAQEEGDYETALAYSEESVATARAVGDSHILTWALGGRGELAYAMGDYPTARGSLEESLQKARDAGNRGLVFDQLGILGWMARNLGDYERARSHYEERLALARESGDPWSISDALYDLVLLAYAEGDLEKAQALGTEDLARRRQSSDRFGEARTLLFLSQVALARRDVETAEALRQESLSGGALNEDRDYLSQSLRLQAQVALQKGDGKQATVLCRERLTLRRKGDWRQELMECLETMAGAAVLLGQPERAARLCGAAEALREGTGMPMPPLERAPHDQRVAAVQATLGEEAPAAARAEGQAMSPEQALQYALEEPDSA